MNAILTMSQFIFPLITFPYVSRILLPEGTGKVSFATSVITYFAMFAQLGIPTYMNECIQGYVELDRRGHEHNITYHGSRYRQPFRNRNQTVGAGR